MKQYIERRFPAQDTGCDLVKYAHRRTKSFYKKAFVRDLSTPDAEKVLLYSYNTPVCAVVNGLFRRIWGGWSATTSRHVHAFCIMMGIPPIGKQTWDNLECFGIYSPELTAFPFRNEWEAAEI